MPRQFVVPVAAYRRPPGSLQKEFVRGYVRFRVWGLLCWYPGATQGLGHLLEL